MSNNKSQISIPTTSWAEPDGLNIWYPVSNIPSEILYPLAVQQIEIDLDDGVKVNYNKFGVALKKVPGLSEN